MRGTACVRNQEGVEECRVGEGGEGVCCCVCFSQAMGREDREEEEERGWTRERGNEAGMDVVRRARRSSDPRTGRRRAGRMVVWVE